MFSNEAVQKLLEGLNISYFWGRSTHPNGLIVVTNVLNKGGKAVIIPLNM